MKASQKLKKWRDTNGLTQRAAALKAGLSQAAWHSIEAGTSKRIGLDVANAIVAVTDGAVSLKDLASPLREAARKKAVPE